MFAMLAAPGAGAAAPAPQSGPAGAAAFTAAWDAYLAGQPAIELQPGCQPRRYGPPAGRERRGAVLLLHGFGGCPQQFQQLGPTLGADGFDVVVPLLPGHGRMPHPDGRETLDAVPAGAAGLDAYAGLVAELNTLMAAHPGPRIAVGYSLGGALALNAVVRAPGLYDRLLLLGPLIAVRGGGPVEWLAALLGGMPRARNWTVKPPGMQRDCEAWTAAGRAGFCDYEYRHVVPLIELARQNREWLALAPPGLPLQVVAAGNEPYVSNRHIRRFVARERQRGTVHFCQMPPDVPHELLTPYENLGRPMYWLAGLIDGLRNFISDAAPFAATGDAGYQVCELPPATRTAGAGR